MKILITILIASINFSVLANTYIQLPIVCEKKAGTLYYAGSDAVKITNAKVLLGGSEELWDKDQLSLQFIGEGVDSNLANKIQSYDIINFDLIEHGAILAEDSGDMNNYYSGIVVKKIGNIIEAKLITQMSGAVTLTCSEQ